VEITTAILSHPFSKGTLDALAKAGTVMLPFPAPASGRLFVRTNPDFNPHLPSGSPNYYLKLVQTVSSKHVITRILGLNELRGVSLPVPSTREGHTSREFRTVNQISREIEAAIQRLKDAEATEPGVYEVCLFEDAVIFVGETAPVVVQIQYEFGVCAAESADNVDLRTKVPICPCGDRSPPIDSP
jgi:hypothetical protein